MIFRRWLATGEIEPVQDATRAALNPALPEGEIRRVLAWFPSEPLVRWFQRGDGGRVGELQFLSLEEAMKWRRETTKRDLPSPLSSADRFLPLIRCELGFFIFDGKAGGLALRRTRRPENYVDALKTPIFLHELLAEQPPPREPIEVEEEEEELDSDPNLVERTDRADHFRLLGWGASAIDEASLSALCRDPLAAEWFRHVGAVTRTLGALTCWSLADALIARDEFEERAAGALRGQLHHHQWMPFAELSTRDRLVWWSEHGLRFHRFSEGQWRVAPWSRLIGLEAFTGALTGSNTTEIPFRVVEPLYRLLEHFAEEDDDFEDTDRELDPTPLGGLKARAALENWFSLAPSRPFAEAGERRVEPGPLKNGAILLLEGKDGVNTWLRDGGGVVLRVGDVELPWAANLTDWVRELENAARAIVEPGVRVTRTIVGHFTIELPLLPFEFARQVEAMTDRWEVDDDLTLERAPETSVHTSRGLLTLRLDAEGMGDLVRALDVQRTPELRWEPLESTFVFKPLR